MKRNQKGVSPVVETVLLIAIVVVISVLVFVWFNQMTEEAITKFEGMNIELVCEDVAFDATYYYGVLKIVNNGNVPIFGIKVKISGEGSHATKDLSEISNWPGLGLNQGNSFSEDIRNDVEDAESIVLIPVLIGNSEAGKKTFVCDENRYGYEIFV